MTIRMLSKVQPPVESIGRIDVMGHSLVAEGGATQLSFGSMHKLTQLFPARFRNLAVGGAQLYKPGALGPTAPAGRTNQDGGWGWIYDQYRGRERNTGIATTVGTATLAGHASGTPMTVVSTTGFLRQGEMVQIGRGATGEVATVAAVTSTTIVFYENLVFAHAIGEVVYTIPDVYSAPRQFGIAEWDWNDIASIGATTFATSFPHAMRAVISRWRSAAVFEDDSPSVRQTTGSWTSTATTAGFASGARYLSTTNNTHVVTIDVPANFPGGTIALQFLTAANGDGALWSISVDGGGTITHDARTINGFDSGSTRAATGQWLASVKRLTGLAAGYHTITVAPTTIVGVAYFDGWLIEAPEPPPLLWMLPRRFYNYVLYATGFPYIPSDSDNATMDTIVRGVLAEYDSMVVPVEMDSIINKQKKYFHGDGAHYNDAGHSEVAIVLATIIQALSIPVRNLLVSTPVDARGWYPLTLTNGWTAYSATEAQPTYYKDIASGVVSVRGAVQLASPTSDPLLALATLPVGHRPANDRDFVCSSFNGPIMVRVWGGGPITLIENSQGPSTFVELNFDFPAEV